LENQKERIVLKKILTLLISIFILSGCTTYKFQKSTAGSQGYLACYDGYPIAEYTMGKEKSLPELNLAKERFKRRRLTVEHYYKKMDQIESRLKAFFWEPPAMIVGFLGGVLRWPFVAVADYKYNHNSKYKAKADKLFEEKDALEAARVSNFRKELDAYIAKDLAEESGGKGVVEAALSDTRPELKVPSLAQEKAVKTEAPVITSSSSFQTVSEEAPNKIATESTFTKQEPAVAPVIESVTLTAPESVKIKPAIKEAPTTQQALEPPVAVITAKPIKGYSPLKVNFSSQKSLSKSGKIVSYLWDFGDGDVSDQKNPQNTYWSATFGSRSFTVTLTVRDQAGSVSSATSTIEVTTR
jgi:hypothetical protein